MKEKFFEILASTSQLSFYSLFCLFVCFLLLFLKTGSYYVALAVLEFINVDQASLRNSVFRMLGLTMRHHAHAQLHLVLTPANSNP